MRLPTLIVILTLALSQPLATAGMNAAYQSGWDNTPDRTWIGPEYWANRLQDWHIANGRLECIEPAPRFPVRTLHLLTRSIDANGDTAITVRTGIIGEPIPGSWRGFLIGAGGPHVDHRLTAQVHGYPAEDGGLLAVVDHTGRVAIRENFRSVRPGGSWSLARPLEENEVPARSLGVEVDDVRQVELRLQVEQQHVTWRVRVSSHDLSTGKMLSSAELDTAPRPHIDGGIALVSHQGTHWFDQWNVDGTAVQRHDGRAYGPVLCTQYTISGGTLKLTAQMGPLGSNDTRTAHLQILDGSGDWRSVATSTLIDDSYTFPFRVEGWNSDASRRFRIAYDLVQRDGGIRPTFYHGRIRAEPVDRDQFIIGSLNCAKVYTGGLTWNHNGIWFPHAEVADALRVHDPDLLFFAGDQIYEGDLDPVHIRPTGKGMLDYLYKWYRWCWSFESVTRDRPTVTIPDDHDVYHGNLWGAAGKRARQQEGITAQDSGGYKMPPRFVNAVHRTQTSHLPDAYDDTLIGEGYTTYYTTMQYAGVSFAILADRQFKSSPTMAAPAGAFRNGWPQAVSFDATTQSDVEGAVLLGERQLEMLREWATDDARAPWAKVVLSQTPFSNIATIPDNTTNGSVIPSLPYLELGEYPEDYKLAADADSNAWPPSGRNRALREFRRAGAIHLAGDQHLASLIHYGIDDWRDAGMAFCSPAISNTWPRRWFPPEPGANRAPGAPRYTGDFFDGFGNRMTVYAVANPVRSGREPTNLHDRMPGYGIVRLSRRDGTITFECWPRGIDPSAPDAWQYPGWPYTATQSEQRGADVEEPE